LDYEIVVADDASEDDCVAQLNEHFPDISVYGSAQRYGPSPTKDRGAQQATGDVLVFLDAHCKPEMGAIGQLVNDVRELNGQAIVTPTIGCLNPETWINDLTIPGQGYLVELDGVTWRWIPTDLMRPQGRFFESPSLIGCCVAMSKWLYEKLWGFDRNMYMWGVEDVDFGVKSWLLGHPVLYDPVPIIGHRFQKSFKYTAPIGHFIANQLRMVYKIVPPKLWGEWLVQFRRRQRPEPWHRGWDIFTIHRGTAEVERVYLYQHQKSDIVSYARRFGLPWPVRPIQAASSV
jgi:glycosyltransferase involved in cell wall biosynthesis